MDNSGRLGETTRDWRETTETMHGDLGIQGSRMDDSGKQRETGRRLQRPCKPGYIGSKDGQQWETARDWGDYRDHGDQSSLHREQGIHNTRRLGEM